MEDSRGIKRGATQALMVPARGLFWGVECTETQALMAIGVGFVFEVDGLSALHAVPLDTVGLA